MMQTQKNIKIGVLSTFPNKYNGITHYVQAIEKLSRKKYIFEHYSVRTKPEDPEGSNVTKYCLTNPGDCNTLLRNWKDDAIDLLHVHYDEHVYGDVDPFSATVNLITLLESVAVPVIFTIHTYYGKRSGKSILGRWMIGRLLKCKAIIVATTEAHGAELVRKHPNYSRFIKSIELTDLALPTSFRRNIIPRQLSIHNKHRITLLTFGFISRYKGQLEILKIIADILIKRDDVVYIIAGSGVRDPKYAEECRRFIVQYLPENRALVIDKYFNDIEMAGFYSAADIYLDYHKNENRLASATMATAIAASVPVVSMNSVFPYRTQGKRVVLVSRSQDEFYRNVSKLLDNPVIMKRNLRKETKINSNYQYSDVYFMANKNSQSYSVKINISKILWYLPQVGIKSLIINKFKTVASGLRKYTPVSLPLARFRTFYIFEEFNYLYLLVQYYLTKIFTY